MPPYARNDYTWHDEEEDDELQDFRGSGRDSVLVCIDASPSMHHLRPDEDDAEVMVSYFSLALKSAMMLERKKALQSSSDNVGILIYNTSKVPDEQGSHQEGMYFIHTIDALSIERIKSLKEVVEASEQDPSHLMSQFPPREEGAKPVSYASLLEQACFEFRAASVKQGTRRVFLVTDDDDPTSRELNPKAVVMGKKAMRTKLKDLSDLGVSIVPFFIDSESKHFDNSLYWNEILNVEPESASSLRVDEEEGNLDYVSAASGLVKFDELLNSMLIRQRPKRALWTVGLDISPGLTIGVKGYGLVVEHKRSAAKYFYSGYNNGHQAVEAIAETDWFDTQDPTAKSPYDPSQIRMAFDFVSTTANVVMGQAGPSRIPNLGRNSMMVGSDEEMLADDDDELEHYDDGDVLMDAKGKGKGVPEKRHRKKITFTKTEVDELRTCGLQPGIKIIGFQDASTLKFEHNIKHSQFIYPEEGQYAGSTRTFTALLRSLLNSNKIGIARCIFRRGSSMLICAMVPQEETFTEFGGQDHPPGFHLIPFPFVDDMREPPVKIQEAETNAVLKSAPEHVEIMHKIIKKLLPKHPYNPSMYPNPVLARHYAYLEAIAFDEDFDSENSGIEDKTVPLYDHINKRVGDQIAEWKASIQSDEMAHSYIVTGTKKRAASGSSTRADGTSVGASTTAGAKRIKAETTLDAQKLRNMWADGTLAKNTVDTLRAFLRTVSAMPEDKRKPSLLEACDAYFTRER